MCLQQFYHFDATSGPDDALNPYSSFQVLSNHTKQALQVNSIKSFLLEVPQDFYNSSYLRSGDRVNHQ
jgi:hypothetical protein